MPATKTKPKFVHLHAHSHYSLLDGLGKVPDIVARVKELGMDSIALTDHGVMYGAIDFFETATEAGIKPIVGCEVYMARGSRHGKDPQKDVKPYHLILLAKDMTGYQNLLKLVTEAHLNGYYYKPRIDWEYLQEHHEGLICSSACLQGEVAQHVMDGDLDGAKDVAARYAKLFGPENYYLELQHHPSIPEQAKVNEAKIAISKELCIPLVATNDAHYVRPDDAEAQDALLCVQTGKLISDTDRMNMMGEDFSLKSPEEMSEAFKDTPEAIANTQKIADMVNLEIPLGGMILPKFDVPDGKTSREYLREQVKAGIQDRYGDTFTKEIADRVAYEMGVIEKMGFESYFLIVADFVNWAKDHDISVGPGRGSGAGSIVAYALRITNLDPMEFGLLFERFLNPDRISMPDFDLDFADDRRGEVIEYVAEKYGSDHVAQIITFGTLGAKAAVRDTGRVMGMGYAEVDAVAKLIPTKPGFKLADARKQSDMIDHEKANPQVERLLDLAEKLEGSNRHASTHAAGVIIGDKPLINYVPMQQATKGNTGVISQYSMNPVEKVGLLKMDFLGLSNLTILRNAQDIIEAVYGVEVDVDELPLDDEKTFKLLTEARTYGVFQLESDGMRRYIKELKPTRFDDITAMVALYRPGPMQFIDSFIKRKQGQEPIKYMHDDLKPSLEETYGVLVYQEQIMQISKDLAGFTGGEADTLRKAVGKKIKALMDKMRPQFVKGVAEKYDKKLGEDLFDLFEAFAQYGFNKAHAACYALIAYQTAYLKAHYPSAFMAALMTSEQENLDKLTMAITECEQLGIKVLPPDVNESFANFAVAPDQQNLRFGLNAVKNLGKNTVKGLIAARKADGPFKDLTDFLCRLPDGTANKKSLEAMIKAGALDSLVPEGDGDPRGRLLAGLEGMCKYAAARGAEGRSGQTSLFGEVDTGRIGYELPVDGNVDDRQKLDWERELLGMYVSEHPLTAYGHLLNGLPSLASLASVPDGRQVAIGGLVGVTKSITTRKGDPMAFVTIEDRHSQLEIITFPKLYAEKRELLTPGTILKITGKISRKDGDVKLLADRIAPLTEASPGDRPVTPVSGHGQDYEEPSAPAATLATDPPSIAGSGESRPDEPAPGPSEVLVVYMPGQTTLEAMEDVKRILDEHRGETPVCLVVPKGTGETRLKLPITVRHSSELTTALGAVSRDVAVESLTR